MFERTWTVVCPANAAPLAELLPDLALPGGEPKLELTAWGSGLEGANAYIFEGGVSAADAADRVAGGGRVDCLTTVPRGGQACIGLPADVEHRLTVYFDTADTNVQAVTIRVRQVG